MITRETLQDFFENTRNLRDEGRARFDIDGICRWSYFFVDTSREKLARVGAFLDASGYEVVGFLEPDPQNEDQDTLYLRADRIEKHTVDSLHERNQELYTIAEQFNVGDYDGMDVGAPDGP
ncbi:MAG TPA: ribonuclease E inhibitor RraB [Acidobacteriota bacterium]|nr:ribonuclease E inhibitor RraB [Acidobacteriota bacterium]